MSRLGCPCGALLTDRSQYEAIRTIRLTDGSAPEDYLDELLERESEDTLSLHVCPECDRIAVWIPGGPKVRWLTPDSGLAPLRAAYDAYAENDVRANEEYRVIGLLRAIEDLLGLPRDLGEP